MKRSLYIAIIVIALGGAAVMAYMAFFSGSSSTDQVEIESAAQVYNILPNGRTLDFDNLTEFAEEKPVFPYPQVTPSEVGQVLGNIIE